MKATKIFFLFFFILIAQNAYALTFKEILLQAYNNNPKLNAERLKFKSIVEEKNEARSEFLPNVSISGYVSEEDNTRGDESNFKPKKKSISIEQNIFQGLGGVAGLEKADLKIEKSRFELKKVEQEILLLSSEVYLDFILSNKKNLIYKKNLDLLERQVETDKARLEKGEISLADLAQSEASYSEAQANLISAENELITSISNFRKVIGIKPTNIEDNINLDLNIPNNLAEAIKTSKNQNPDLKISELELKIAEKDVKISKSNLSPSAVLSYELSESDDLSATVQDRKQQTLKATATWPIYSGGKNISSLKKNRKIKGQKELLLKNSLEETKSDVSQTWSYYQSSKGVFRSTESQLKAAEIAHDGIASEYELGKDRTTLDVIQSLRILLNARIDLANAERNLLLSRISILSAVGNLTAKYLNLTSK